ncbi:TIGR03000 domain-containing protein [Urbifossiella limnaea]|uniref:TIGR03000 domain-containing protein n=1 Tax=Urbifossiella limnaea TaxID=2528023 RepID=A0A517XUA5_9BACT|nr:TIGR03000 domain-containing protein [Urbifossiella limnaea]QDU21092.1 hypothetical protein ETAA1_30570 [Urbifossiella limnaea]
MYSIVLMAATTGGPVAPAADHTPVVVAAPVAAGCCGGVAVGCTGSYSVGCWGSCTGSYSAGCCGGRGGLFHRHKHSSGCCGGYSSGCCGGWACFGSSAYAAWGGCHGTVSYGPSAAGCWGTVYGGGYGCWGSSYGSAGYAPPAVVIPVETAPAAPMSEPAPKTNPLPKSGGAGKDGASLRFQLPPTAALFVDGNRVAGQGADRAFYTPPLQAGQRYFYDVRAEVVVNGQTVTEEKRVVVTAGADLVETFPRLLAAVTDPATVAGR